LMKIYMEVSRVSRRNSLLPSAIEASACPSYIPLPEGRGFTRVSAFEK
jgi:hypothetical protein